MKLERGEVDGYQSYFNLVAKRGQPDMTVLVAQYRILLLSIELSVKPEVKPLEPLKPMLETLEAYCRSSDVKLTVK